VGYTDTAVTREAAFLADYNPTDGLPALLAGDGGPWDVVQAYATRTPREEARAIYVMRNKLDDHRTANVRVMAAYRFRLALYWPLLALDGSAEEEQQAFDTAVDLLLTRIRGLLGDKTHGGRFLSVGESPRVVEVEFHDPMHTVPLGYLAADCTYSADDFEINA
jgi:hypothetical protein